MIEYDRYQAGSPCQEWWVLMKRNGGYSWSGIYITTILDFVKNGLLIPLAMPHIQFLFVGTGCLQSRLLQCMDYSITPCGLLKLRNVTSAFKRLSLSGFLFLRTIFTIQGTPKVFIKAGRT